MKIANKIRFIIFFLVAVLVVNTIFGLQRVSKIGKELQDIVNKDIVLTGISTSITQYQLKKAILFERILSIVEEMGFQNLPPSRNQHLKDEIIRTERGFNMLAQKGAVDILKGKDIIAKGARNAEFTATKQEFNNAAEILSKIEKAHIEYDQIINRIFELINTDKYESNIEDLYSIEHKEKYLSAQLQTLVEQMQRYTRQSVDRAKKEETSARQFLIMVLLISMGLGLLIALSIIRSFSRPLRNLVHATHQVSAGDFVVNLNTSSKDEIGEVSSAFNQMSKSIQDFKTKLEERNQELGTNLKITEQQKHDLERVNQELDRFVYTVSHDIGAPLMGIIGYGDFLAKNYSEKLDERGQLCVEKMRKSAFRLNAMIKDLLTLTRISRIKNPYELASIKEMIDEVLERLEYSIKRFNVEVSLVSNFPIIVCDRIKLVEVFYNLLSNAIKFSSKNTTYIPKVEIGYVEHTHGHEFFVRDNGIGISPEDHDEIFVVFKRLHSVQEYEGTGAGLGIVANVIKDHGGKIWVESKLGEGATFRFIIPKNLKISADLEGSK
ncbi:MAG: HAMP domain-containing protein [Candidatus Omnitrophica bacterium]|nr:HAMP domain-containing protein [Candidatus Omnitrophota bacterium]